MNEGLINNGSEKLSKESLYNNNRSRSFGPENLEIFKA